MGRKSDRRILPWSARRTSCAFANVITAFLRRPLPAMVYSIAARCLEAALLDVYKRQHYVLFEFRWLAVGRDRYARREAPRAVCQRFGRGTG